jgi:O-antigen/teichoic acid export membrane protein
MRKKVKLLISNKEFYWTLLFQITILIGGILLIKLLAISLSKENYGFYTLIMSIVSLILMMPFTAFFQGVSRYISIYQKKRSYKRFLSSIILLINIIVTLYLLLFFIFNSILTIPQEWDNKLIYIIIFVTTEIFKILFKTINNANRHRKTIAIAIFIEFFIKIIIIFTIYQIYSVEIINVLIALIIANILSILIMYSKNIQDISIFKVTLKYFKIHILRIWLFSYPLLIWALFGWLRDMSNRWYLDYFLDKEQVALFAMMGSLALVVPLALQGIIGSFFIPIIYQKENKQKGFTQKILVTLLPLLVIFFLISFIIVYFTKDFIVIVLTDTKYLSISWMLPWMFLTYSLYVISMISTYELFAHRQTKKLILSSILPGVISLIGGYFLIKNYGIVGALYNYIITYTSYSLLTLYVVYKYKEK